MHNHSLKHLSHLLQSKQISSREVTEHYLKRIGEYNKTLNCFVTVTESLALRQAAAADARLQQGDNTPLLGIPIAHKDLFCTQGVKTSCGSKMLDNFIPPYDATVVEKFKNAGMVLLGKTNMDEFAMGSSNENSYYGPTRNPWNLECVPGGSSGGSAAAVAARLVPGATGTDTGGSIRQPAAFCGITGIKPTYGLVSRYGMIAFASSLDQGGPMAASAEDCALLLQTMAGFDDKDSTSYASAIPDYQATLNNPLTGKTIGLPKQFFSPDLSPEIATVMDQVISHFKTLGVQFKEIDLARIGLSVPAYYVLASAEASSNLARYDGVRFGYRCKNPVDLTDLYERTRGEGFGSEVKRRILIGTYALSAGYYDAYYAKAQQIRRLIHNDWQTAFAEVDLILSPTTPSPAFKIGAKSTDPVSMYLSDIYTIGVNLAGLPALSLPGGFVEQKPVGVQLIGNHFQEALLLNAAHQFQLTHGAHLMSPLK